MIRKAISATKGNRLYWLGRYTERVYISLHLLRRYYDKMIDGSEFEYDKYCRRIEATNPYPDAAAFWESYMYSLDNPCSLISGLQAAFDNGIVLREEIMTETLSYIHMSLAHIQRAKEKEESNIADFQPITDYLLAFWGSIYERVFDKRVRNFIRIGKLIENLDMHVRFDYPWYRIEEAYENLKECASEEDGIFDQMILRRLNELITPSNYSDQTADYKPTVLKFINHLVLI